MNIVFGNKRPQSRQLFGDGAFGRESSKCVQDSHVADPVLEESAFEIIADATMLPQHFLTMPPHVDVGAVSKVKAAAAEKITRDERVENFVVGPLR